MMSRLSRLVIGPALVVAFAAGIVVVSETVSAQPPGFGRGFDKEKDRDFEKGDKGKGKDKGFEKGDKERKAEPTPADPVKTLEAELARVKAEEAALEAKLKRAKEAAARPAAPAEFPRGGPGGMGGFGGFPGGGAGGGRGGSEPGGFGGGGPGGGFGGSFDRMTVEQIKELMGQLQKALDEKLKALAPPRVPGANSQDEVLKRLDKLSKELEEIRKSIRR